MGSIPRAGHVIRAWPQESREASQLVLDSYGEPDEVTSQALVWNRAGPWKRIVATREFTPHRFPAPHHDSVQCVLSYPVPAEKVAELAHFDGSVVVDRTRGELSARCHDEEANNLALNLADEIVAGHKTVQEARAYYAAEFLGHRRGEATPYMDRLRVSADDEAADPGERILSDEDLKQAVQEGEQAQEAQQSGPGPYDPREDPDSDPEQLLARQAAQQPNQAEGPDDETARPQ